MPCGIEVAAPKTISGYYNIYLRLHLLLEHRWSGAMLKRNIQIFFDPWSCISGIAIKNAARIRFIQVRYSVKTPGNRIEQSCFKMWNATCFRSEQPDRVQGVVQRNNTDCHKKVLFVQICLINRVSKIHYHYESEENPFANMIFVSVFFKDFSNDRTWQSQQMCNFLWLKEQNLKHFVIKLCWCILSLILSLSPLVYLLRSQRRCWRNYN